MGVRQGNNLSPLLFSIFIYQALEYVRKLNMGITRENETVSFINTCKKYWVASRKSLLYAKYAELYQWVVQYMENDEDEYFRNKIKKEAECNTAKFILGEKLIESTNISCACIDVLIVLKKSKKNPKPQHM